MQQRRYSRLVVPGGILAEAGPDTAVSAQQAPVDSEAIEE